MEYTIAQRPLLNTATQTSGLGTLVRTAAKELRAGVLAVAPFAALLLLGVVAHYLLYVA